MTLEHREILQTEIEPFSPDTRHLVLLPLRADLRALDLAANTDSHVGLLAMINHHIGAPNEIIEENKELYKLLFAIQKKMSLLFKHFQMK